MQDHIFFLTELLARAFAQIFFSRIFFRIFFCGFSFECSFADFLSKMVMQDRIFFLTELLHSALLKAMKAIPRFSFKYSFVDFLSNIFSRIFFRGFSFEYFFTDFLSIMFMRDYIQIQFTGVRSDGTVTQASLKAILSRILFCGFSF